jgi:HPt (histidine-containing phosphotransfer) domain-containing protein
MPEQRPLLPHNRTLFAERAVRSMSDTAQLSNSKANSKTKLRVFHSCARPNRSFSELNEVKRRGPHLANPGRRHRMGDESDFFNGSEILSKFDGDVRFAAECTQALADELPELLQTIRGGIRAASSERVVRAAHTLKGALSHFVIGGPTQTAALVERLAKEGRLDEAPAALSVLERQIGVLLTGLRELCPITS